MAKVSLQGVSKFYGKVQAVKKIDLEIIDKEFLVLVGPSGCGKSSSLRMIAGLEEIDEGVIKIGDKEMNNLEPRERNVSMVYQQFINYPNFTVYENIALPLHINGVGRKKIKDNVEEALELTDLLDFKYKYPEQLSGGEQQRVAIARALVTEPKVVFADEPTGNLDQDTAKEIEQLLFQMNHELGTTLVLVTHDQKLASQCQRQLQLDDGNLLESTHRNALSDLKMDV